MRKESQWTRPIIFTDDTHPSHFIFANQIGVQTDEDEQGATQVPDELSRTIESHLWLANLEMSSGIDPYYVCNGRNAQRTTPRGPN